MLQIGPSEPVLIQLIVLLLLTFVTCGIRLLAPGAGQTCMCIDRHGRILQSLITKTIKGWFKLVRSVVHDSFVLN